MINNNEKYNIKSYLKQSQLVRFTRAGILIPSAVRILDAPVATVVPSVAHGQVDLLDPVIGGHVQRLPRLANLHHLDRLVLSNFEDIQQLGLGLPVRQVVHDFVDPPGIGSDVINRVLLIEDVDFYSANEGKLDTRIELE